MKHRLLALLLILGFVPAAFAGEAENQRASNAVRVLRDLMQAPDRGLPSDMIANAYAVGDLMQAPDRGLPSDMIANAYAVAVIPDVIKAGLVIGGRHGLGLISVKTDNGTWSNPSFISMSGGSIGFQAGVSSTDVILVFRTQRGVDSIVHGKFTLGADASAAAGPVGRTAQASTDAQLKAEIFSYSRARGLFAGAALDGSVISIDNDANAAVYGAGVTPRRIFAGGVSSVPNAVVDFRDRLEEYSH